MKYKVGQKVKNIWYNDEGIRMNEIGVIVGNHSLNSYYIKFKNFDRFYMRENEFKPVGKCLNR